MSTHDIQSYFLVVGLYHSPDQFTGCFEFSWRLIWFLQLARIHSRPTGWVQEWCSADCRGHTSSSANCVHFWDKHWGYGFKEAARHGRRVCMYGSQRRRLCYEDIASGHVSKSDDGHNWDHGDDGFVHLYPHSRDIGASPLTLSDCHWMQCMHTYMNYRFPQWKWFALYVFPNRQTRKKP